jgi:hypothetical protein
MIRRVVLLTLVLASALSFTSCIHVSDVRTDRAAAVRPHRQTVLRHVVLFSWKPGTQPDEIRAIENAFAALPTKIDAIHDLEWGTDVSVEGISQGFTHCFIVTFLSEEARDEYLPHPAHRAFGDLIRPYLQDVLVVDFWARE